MESQPNPSSPHSGAVEDIPLLDVEYFRQVLGFGLRAIWRRRGLTVGVFVVITGAVIAAVILMPRTYFTEVKILAQQNMVMPALGNPRRTIPSQSDEPTKLATEAVMQRESLVGIMDQTHLLEEWEARRPPVLRAKDWVMERLEGPFTRDDKVEALIGVLKLRMWVATGDGTVTIGIVWPSAEMAYRIVSTAQQNFLEERHASEVSMIGESIGILESHATEVRATIDSAVNDLRELQPPKSPTRSGARSAARTEPKADPEAARLQALLTAKRKAITDLVEARDRRIADLQAQLAEEKTTYGAAHPAIATTQQAIDALSVESPQLATLRREEASLIAQLGKRGIAPDVVTPSRPLAPVIIPMMQAADSLNAKESYARSRLRIAVNAYEDLLDRLEGAHIELETARAAFKYKYRVLDPVKIPKKPLSPRVPLVVGGGLVFAMMLGIGVAILADVMSGRVIETWQVDRLLGLSVLAEVERG